MNSCYTYFKICGNFDPDVVTNMLGLQPNSSWNLGTAMQNGEPRPFSLWTVGRCDDYDVITENQVKKTISQLKDKIQLLNLIRERYDATFTIEIVPQIYTDETTPALVFDLEIIEFCNAIKANIDIDLYVHSS